MTETPQDPSQNPYVTRPEAEPAGAQPAAAQPATGHPAPQPGQPVTVEAQAGEYAWGNAYGQVPPAGVPPVGSGPGLGAAPHRRGPRRVGLSITVAVAVLAAAVGGVSGAYFDHHLDQNDAASVSVVTGSNSSDSTTAVGAVAKAALPSVVKITEQTNSAQGVGSGIVVSSNGDIVTNNHVIADYVGSGGTLTVTTYNGKTYNAKVVGFIAADDIAVIQAEGGSGWAPLAFANSDDVQVGDQTVAIGSPDDLQNTVTSGIVSALNRQVSVSESSTEESGSSGNGGFPGFNWGSTETTVTYSAIQTDASINPGNSGGPLLNSSGQVIGMNSSIYSSSSNSGSSSDSGSVGLGFAIPANKVVQDIKKIEAGQGDSTSSSNSNSNSGSSGQSGFGNF